ncbi:MAG: hypothetical protein FSLLV1_gp2 [Hangzhou scotinophara lurida lispivirus 1]|uniref:Uncharacterized protein n=1 Tax=Hangzhou scotinophara lurida lispivirus 1 TaxID=2905569 RepID=A0A8K1XW11_9MONO|nr:MAG: hypothetical protein QKV01_gp2 [Hangzhou scotinophara lurida lispivirus 1]UHK03259.1 MAG: hypothetical protein FSLLV1_gp2 [Hangzhou scotinophara lurida lispivirus 1]
MYSIYIIGEANLKNNSENGYVFKIPIFYNKTGRIYNAQDILNDLVKKYRLFPVQDNMFLVKLKNKDPVSLYKIMTTLGWEIFDQTLLNKEIYLSKNKLINCPSNLIYREDFIYRLTGCTIVKERVTNDEILEANHLIDE